MNKFDTQKINGRGWSGLVIQLKREEDIDLLELLDKHPKKYPFFLDSSSRGNVQNRNSIIFYKPDIILKKKNDQDNFLEEFNSLWKKNKINQEIATYKKSKSTILYFFLIQNLYCLSHCKY